MVGDVHDAVAVDIAGEGGVAGEVELCSGGIGIVIAGLRGIDRHLEFLGGRDLVVVILLGIADRYL